MLQASILDCRSFDPIAIDQDFLTASKVDVGWCQIAQALMIAPVIVMLDEPFDVGFEISGQIIVFQQNAILECLMPALDFALRLRMTRGAARVAHIAFVEPLGELSRDVGRAIVRIIWDDGHDELDRALRLGAHPSTFP
jgi:hypothetical protein